MTSLRKIISVSFMVRSSSLVPDFRSLTTDGRMQRGGTRRRVRIRSAGFPASGFISSRGMSSWGILLNMFSTTRGFRFSWRGNDNKGKIQGCTGLPPRVKSHLNIFDNDTYTLVISIPFLGKYTHEILQTHFFHSVKYAKLYQ